MAQIAFAVAGSGISVVDREAATLLVLAQWLTGIEENYQVPLYVRALEPAYLSRLPEIFGLLPDHLSAPVCHGSRGSDSIRTQETATMAPGFPEA